ncbi:MAG: YfhO family protein [Lachnospiraceae bacterium]|nr:YfhO family protein [Lachnospiraceae bacterium]
MRTGEHKGRQKAKYFLLYTVIFLPMVWLVFRYFFHGNRTFVWMPDGWRQHYKGLLYYSEWIREVFKRIFVEHSLELPAYSFSIGYGSDVLTTLHYYAIGDPLTLLAAFIKEEHMLFFYEFLLVLRLYLAGAAFSCYCFYRGRKNTCAVLAGAFVYLFCGYALFAGVRHPYFINPMIYLPLLLTGVERFLKERKAGVFVGSVFLSAVSNFYFFYTLAFFTALYVFFHLAVRYRKKEWRTALWEVLRLAGYALVGVMMAAAILLPVILMFMGNSRLSTGYAFEAFYGSRYYGSFLPAFLSYGTPGSWCRMGYAGIAVVALFSLFSGIYKRKDGEKGSLDIHRLALGAAFLLLTLFLLLPFFGYALNGFAYVSNRWEYSYSMLVAFIVVKEWDRIFCSSLKKLLFMAGFTALYAGISILAAKKFAPEMEVNVWMASAALLATFLVLAIVYAFRNRPQAGRKGIFIRVVKTMPLIFLLGNIVATAHCSYSPGQGDYASEFKRRSRFAKDFVKSEAGAVLAAAKEEQEFYRYTGRDLIPNASLKTGVHNTQFYWSLGNGVIAEYFAEQGLTENTTFNYMGLDDRAALCALAAVKYHVTVESGEGYAPYGYEKEELGEEYEKYHISRNTLALPLGYTYENYILYEDYAPLSALQKQEALLQGAVLSKALEGLEEIEPVNTGVEREFTVSYDKKKVSETENGFLVKKRNATVTFEFDGLPECETYLVISGLYYDWTDLDGYKDIEQKMTISLVAEDEDGGTVKKDLKYLGASQEHYSGRHDYSINLCYSGKRKVSVSLTFPRAGTYRMDQVQIICQPMQSYEEAVLRLSKESLQEVELNEDNKVHATSHISGKITLSEPKLLLLAIPYADGWSAYVDGKPQEILQANTMFCALFLPAGEHEIVLRYRTPGLVAGIVVSAVGILVWVCLALPKTKRFIRIGSGGRSKKQSPENPDS